MKFPLPIIALLLVFLLDSCKQRQPEEAERKASMGSIFAKKHVADTAAYDLSQILKGGEIIITTMSGPDNYYDYHGMGMGLQYVLVENFAEKQGLSIRVEIASDTAALVQKVLDHEADLIAYPLSEAYLSNKGLRPTGYKKKGRWGVRKDAIQLAEALDDWYGDGVEVDVSKRLDDRRRNSQHVERKVQAVYLSRERGVISVYDNLFHNASVTTGWDWKLIAAMCYQESGFDPNARSYVGARGLMQLMPRTAESLGVPIEEITNPEKNVDAAARYLAKIEQQFSDIKDRNERIKFVLASYNGGSGHVRDAMALAKKYGHNPQVWDEVSPYILALSQPQFYKDPVVKRGYMVGRETAGYVQRITERWHDYGGHVAVCAPPHLPDDSHPNASEVERRMNAPAQRPNRYSPHTKVMRPDDPRFNQME